MPNVSKYLRTTWTVKNSRPHCFLQGNCLVSPDHRAQQLVDLLQRSSGFERTQELQSLAGSQQLYGKHCGTKAHVHLLPQTHTVYTVYQCFHSEPGGVSPCSTCSTTLRALRAAQPPIDTWSSVAALVDRESMEDGWHRALFSDTARTVFKLMQTAVSKLQNSTFKGRTC